MRRVIRNKKQRLIRSLIIAVCMDRFFTYLCVAGRCAQLKAFLLVVCRWMRGDYVESLPFFSLNLIRITPAALCDLVGQRSGACVLVRCVHLFC
jgi:hypothetical protein